MRVVAALVVVSIALTGCVMPAEEGSAEDTAHAQLEAMWRTDADALIGTYTKPWFDFGGDEWVADPGANVRRVMAEETFQNEMAKYDSWQELVRLDEVVMGHPDDLGEAGDFFQSDVFELQPDDVSWFAPPSEGSPLFDGWGGLYREIDGDWKMVGGD